MIIIALCEYQIGEIFSLALSLAVSVSFLILFVAMDLFLCSQTHIDIKIR